MRPSIVVNTLDRASYLRPLLDSFEHLDHPSFEVVVVNGPSTDDTEAVLARYAGRIKVARCPERNLSRSRNIGIAAAAGEIVVFIDDDALPATRDWLTRLCSALTDNPRAGGVGGPVLNGDGTEYEFQGRIVSDYGMQYNSRDAARLALTVDGRRWVRSVAGGNCAFRREVLMQIGGFDEAFNYYLDETDVCLRVSRAGHDVVYEPRSAVLHHKAPSARRRSPYDLPWDVMARSDAYYVLKNAADPLLRRLLTMLRLARQKHFFREINWHYREGRYGAGQRLVYLGRWASGLAAGAWAGLTAARRVPLGPTTPSPRPFLRFPHAGPPPTA